MVVSNRSGHSETNEIHEPPPNAPPVVPPPPKSPPPVPVAPTIQERRTNSQLDFSSVTGFSDVANYPHQMLKLADSSSLSLRVGCQISSFPFLLLRTQQGCQFNPNQSMPPSQRHSSKICDHENTSKRKRVRTDRQTENLWSPSPSYYHRTMYYPYSCWMVVILAVVVVAAVAVAAAAAEDSQTCSLRNRSLCGLYRITVVKVLSRVDSGSRGDEAGVDELVRSRFDKTTIAPRASVDPSARSSIPIPYNG